MPITVHEIGPDGQLVQTTIGDDDAPPAAPAAPAAVDTPPASAPAAPDAQTPAAPAPEAPAPPDSAPDVPAPSETTEEDDEEAPVPLTKGVQRRIDRLTRQREEARRAQAALEERLRMLEQGYQRPPPEPQPQPAARESTQRADYATDEEWLDARVDARVQQRLEAAQLEQLRQRQQQEAEARRAQLTTREREFSQEHPDYYEQIERVVSQLAPQLREGLLDSDQAPALAYHLARHPDDVQRLNGLQPLALSRALGHLEAQLSAPVRPTPPPPTAKPAPPTPLNGAGSPGPRRIEDLSDADIDAMSQREWDVLWQRQYPKVR